VEPEGRTLYVSIVYVKCNVSMEGIDVSNSRETTIKLADSMSYERLGVNSGAPVKRANCSLVDIWRISKSFWMRK